MIIDPTGVEKGSVTVEGSRWRRVDFHLHTPGVSSFAASSGTNLQDSADQRGFAEAYAWRLHEAGIEVAAITDYNGVRQPWFDLVRDAAAVHDILVLPGAELSLNVGKNGIHILAVFPPGTDPQEVNECLRGLDRQPGKRLWNGREHYDIELSMPLGDAMRQLRERFGCLLFAAHAKDRKGIVAAMGPKPAAELIAEAQLDGVDHAAEAITTLRSTGVPFRWEQLAMVEFSDPRSLADVGGKTSADGVPRGTWLKLSATDLDAMRLALHDPQTRVRVSAPLAPHNGQVVSMQVVGSGFLGGIELTFDAHLNTLIGGRGAGKSAVLETIRYALDIAPYCDPERRQRLVDHALGAGGSVRLGIERCTESGTAKRYDVVRVLGQPPQVLDLDTGAQVHIPPQDTFGPNQAPIVLLQREIEVISTDMAYRRDLLDRLIGDDVHRAEARVAEVRRKLSLNSAELRKHRLEQARRPELSQRVTALEHQLKVCKDNGVLDKLADHRRFDMIDRRLAAAYAATASGEPWSQSLIQAQEDLNKLTDQLTAADDEVTRQAADILAEAAGAVDVAREQLTAVAAQANGRIAALRHKHTERVQALTSSLNEVKQLLHAEKFDANEILRHTPELDQLRVELDALERQQPAMEVLQHDRRGILDELAKAREEQSRVRLDAAEQINGRLSQRLEVVVEPFGDREQFTTDLRTLFSGSGAQTAAITTIAQTEDIDGAAIASTVEEGPNAIATRFGLTTTQAGKIHAWLTDPEADRIAELEALAPRDRVVVRLRTGQENRDLDELSAGQRATAILLLIFTVDGRTMLLDQPEDDLDNRFIFEDVVAMIRQQKALTPDGRDRQIITATHNPNIPMLGDAELVAVLDATNAGMRIASYGSIDALEIRTHIRQVLEGGEEAFLRRYHKYGGMRMELPIPR